MKTDMVHYYYKNLETGVEMSFSKSDQWGWGVHFVNLHNSLDYKGHIPWPTLSAEEQAVVDENYRKLYEALEEEDE